MLTSSTSTIPEEDDLLAQVWQPPSRSTIPSAARWCFSVWYSQLSTAAADYAITLRAWRAAWEARQAEALKLGYSQRFWRKYRQACSESCLPGVPGRQCKPAP